MCILQEVEELLELFNKVRDRISEKVVAVQNASSKVADLKKKGKELVKDLDSRLQRIIGKCLRKIVNLEGIRKGSVDHFRVPLGLCIETRLGAQPLIWK